MAPNTLLKCCGSACCWRRSNAGANSAVFGVWAVNQTCTPRRRGGEVHLEMAWTQKMVHGTESLGRAIIGQCASLNVLHRGASCPPLCPKYLNTVQRTTARQGLPHRPRQKERQLCSESAAALTLLQTKPKCRSLTRLAHNCQHRIRAACVGYSKHRIPASKFHDHWNVQARGSIEQHHFIA
jgi:hypothetical protein